MADPAFDAFTQRRDTGTKDRVTERRRVDTYTDPNRYQMPPRRRLGVHAQNKSMFVTPEKENITAFASSIVEMITKLESDLLTGLNNMYGTMNEETFKEMRRVLPLTKEKFNWNVNAHKMVTSLRK